MLQVRPMQKADIDSVYAIELEAHTAPWTYKIINDCVLVGYDCRVLELQQEHGLELIGYVICSYQERICHVLNLAVADQFRHQGYGRLILEQVIESLKNTSIDTIILEVRQSNQVALRLYQRLGFHTVGIKTAYYHDEAGVEDAVVLTKGV